ncbi:MAG: (Fe-S)-binding protein [Candidatus Helarchaeota archaeon]
MATEREEMFSKDELLRLNMCSTCMKMCKDVCPTLFVTRNELHTPYNRSLLINLHEKNIRKCDGEALEGIFSCLLCEACQSECHPQVDFAGLCKKARASLVSEGMTSTLERLTEMFEYFKTTHNPLGEDPEKRAQEYDDAPKNNNAEILYFVGCMASYREPDIARATINILQMLRKEFQVLKADEWCCGSPIISTGNQELAREVKAHNIQKFRESGARIITTACPACYNVLTNEYGEELGELKITVKYVLDFFQDEMQDLSMKPRDDKVTFHDPCHLGRKMDYFDVPRAILKNIDGLEFIEMERSKEKSMCCGSGGGVRHDYPDLSARVGLERLNEAVKIGADILLTSCPLCKNQFRKLIEDKELPLKVKDLVEYI